MHHQLRASAVQLRSLGNRPLPCALCQHLQGASLPRLSVPCSSTGIFVSGVLTFQWGLYEDGPITDDDDYEGMGPMGGYVLRTAVVRNDNGEIGWAEVM